MHSLLHTDTQILTSHVGKTVELCYLRITGNLLDIFIVAHSDIIRAYQRDMKEWQLSWMKKWVQKNFKWVVSLFWLHPVFLMSIYVTFFVNSLPPSWVMYFLKIALEVHSEPCQISKMKHFAKLGVRRSKSSKLAVNK